MSDDFTGQTIEGYELREKMGEGGHGVVYKAYRIADGLPFAIKVMLPEKAKDEEFLRRFEQEAQVIAELQHPNIISLVDFWQNRNGAFMAMRWLPGGSLRKMFQPDGLGLEAAIKMLEQIAGALSVAHKAGIIHRDVKPDNILFDEAGQAYLTDFGIARRMASMQRITQPGQMVGAPAYLSPEQISEKAISAATDVYGLGITLYETLTGKHPFINSGSIMLMMKHLYDPLPPLSKYKDNLPALLDQVLRKATNKDPVNRYASALMLLDDFRAAAGL